MASCASPLQPSPSSSSSSIHKMLSKAIATSFSSPRGAPSHSNFARSALSDLLPADATKKQANPSSSSSPSSCIQNYAQSPLIRSNNWVSNTFFESSRNDHSKENRENREEERVEREQERQGIDVVRLSSSILKRKRPAKLAIPELGRLASFGKVKHFGLPRQEDFSPEAQSQENEKYGVCAKKGRKEYMEDTHLALTDFQGKPGQAFFGVFDGHGGRHAATFAAQNLGRHILAAMENQNAESESLEDAMRDGYMALDSEFLAKNTSSGACSLSVLLKDGHLVVANAGDCKAVLSRGGKAEALNTLHRASNAEERQRIEDLGGYVDCFNGVWRLQSTLAVTRGFGDANLKGWVSAEPEVRQLMISEECEFLILATDGLWDKVSDQEAVDCAREVLLDYAEPQTPVPCKAQKYWDSSRSRDCDSIMHSKGKPSVSSSSSSSSLKVGICEKLIHKSCTRGNLDDITILIVPLQGFVAASS